MLTIRTTSKILTIESELISTVSEEEVSPQNLDAELEPIAQEEVPAPVEEMLADQSNQTEDRIKDLSQKFFTEEAPEKTPEANSEQAEQFSEMPGFGENLDLSQVAPSQPTQDEMEFPPNPFGEENQPGSLPNPDVPEDL